MSCDTCFTRDFKDPVPFDPGPVIVLEIIQELDRLTLSASRFIGSRLPDGGFRVESSCLGPELLADTGDAKGEEATATDLTADSPNVAVCVGLFLTQVMLLRFP